MCQVFDITLFRVLDTRFSFAFSVLVRLALETLTQTKAGVTNAVPAGAWSPARHAIKIALVTMEVNIKKLHSFLN